MTVKEPRAWTAEEARKMFLAHLQGCAEYWAKLPNKTPLERTEGVLFSMLVCIDGGTMPLPGMDIVLRPHEEDERFNRVELGHNWFVDGMVINDCQLHEELVRPHEGR